MGVTAMMAQRAIHLGGIHIHKLFALKVSGSMTLHQMADAGIDKLLKDPVLLHTLKNLHVLLIDEIGQVSAEMLAILDIILRKVRGSNICRFLRVCSKTGSFRSLSINTSVCHLM